MLKATYDKQANAGYLKFSDNKILKTTPINDNILCDLDKDGMLVGIEFISLPKEKIQEYSKKMVFKELSHAY
ncbi:DUF2283 domain-containing protein [Candidatus Gracilibacteria bacterium]|nr:DUF2283 domain-containing protein [Candidatus Gracilibacteria bacterium]